jgi:hypothetical protein
LNSREERCSINTIIGCDAHKRYSLFVIFDTSTLSVRQTRVNHHPGAIPEFLSAFPEGTTVALETVGNYHRIDNEIQEAGCVPLMAHAAKAKVIMGNINKTDRLDAQGTAPSSTLEAYLQFGCLPVKSATSLSSITPEQPSAKPDRLEKPHPRHSRQMRIQHF